MSLAADADKMGAVLKFFQNATNDPQGAEAFTAIVERAQELDHQIEFRVHYDNQKMMWDSSTGSFVAGAFVDAHGQDQAGAVSGGFVDGTAVFYLNINDALVSSNKEFSQTLTHEFGHVYFDYALRESGLQDVNGVFCSDYTDGWPDPQDDMEEDFIRDEFEDGTPSDLSLYEKLFEHNSVFVNDLTSYVNQNIAQGYARNDLIQGTSANDHYFGGGGSDTLSGASGNDYLHGGDGSDNLSGGGGDDILVIDANDNFSNIDGGAGVDLIQLESHTGAALDLSAMNAENALGGGGNDVILGTGASNIMNGANGNDSLRGRGGNDTYLFSYGDDRVVEGSGVDIIKTSENYDNVLIVEDGNDLKIGLQGVGDIYVTDCSQILTIVNWADGGGRIVENIEIDGTTYDLGDLLAIDAAPEVVDDSLVATYGTTYLTELRDADPEGIALGFSIAAVSGAGGVGDFWVQNGVLYSSYSGSSSSLKNVSTQAFVDSFSTVTIDVSDGTNTVQQTIIIRWTDGGFSAAQGAAGAESGGGNVNHEAAAFELDAAFDNYAEPEPEPSILDERYGDDVAISDFIAAHEPHEQDFFL